MEAPAANPAPIGATWSSGVIARWAPAPERTPLDAAAPGGGGPSLSPRPVADVLDAIIISDLHLGCDSCQAKLLLALLECLLAGTIRTGRLIINGDGFDSFDFRRLKKNHWKVLSVIRRLSDKMEVIWTSGNHDGPAEIISHLLGVQVREEFILTSGPRRVLVLHGDIFDDFIDQHPLVTWVGDAIYNMLQRVDRRHHIARLAKSRSKLFLHCAAKVRQRAIQHARRRGCQSVICGHTHQVAADIRGPIAYFNSGCWTELPPTYLTVRGGTVTVCRFQASPSVTSWRPKG